MFGEVGAVTTDIEILVQFLDRALECFRPGLLRLQQGLHDLGHPRQHLALGVARRRPAQGKLAHLVDEPTRRVIVCLHQFGIEQGCTQKGHLQTRDQRLHRRRQIGVATHGVEDQADDVDRIFVLTAQRQR